MKILISDKMSDKVQKLKNINATLTEKRSSTKKYVDFLSAYSAVNQGHSNPTIIKALTKQSQQLSLTSWAFHNDKFSEFAKLATSYFAFDMMLPMNTGAEAVETAIKLARKWGVQKKKISENQGEIEVCQNNFHNNPQL